MTLKQHGLIIKSHTVYTTALVFCLDTKKYSYSWSIYIFTILFIVKKYIFKYSFLNLTSIILTLIITYIQLHLSPDIIKS